MPKVYIKTFGCQMNDRDSEALCGLFLDKGYSLADSPENADVILVNTCSVREHAENRAISFLGSLKKLTANRYSLNAPIKPIIGLIGCMARNRGEELFKRMPHLDLICSPGCFDNIPTYIEKIINEKIRIVDLEDRKRRESFYSTSYKLEPNHAQVVISTGCSNFCSYCVVPYARGQIRPRSPDSIIREIEKNVKSGIEYITLLGQNVNDYQYKTQGNNDTRIQAVNFVDLLEKVIEIERLEEIDFITAHPKNTSEKLFNLMAKSNNIRKHLHLPFQSGADRILKLMNRGYTKSQYLGLAADYKRITGGSLSTDVIVGYPTETEEDFLHTKDVLETVRFKYAYIFKYSPRPNTGAKKLVDDVPREEKERRHKILLDLQKSISLNRLEARNK